MLKKKNVVVIGGGNGSAISLVALKQNLSLFDISAVIAMSDSGSSSGRLRKELGVLPPGDIMRAVLALSKYDYPLLKRIFNQNRFTGPGKLKGHNLGNLFLALGTQYGKDFLKSVQALGESVETVGTVYPVTLKPGNLTAQLSNGKIIKSEANIDEPNYKRSLRIQKVWLEPKLLAYKDAVKTILEADYIVLSPGSLYTSVIATLLPAGIFEAIDRSKAKLLYIAGNAYRTHGETGPVVLSEAVSELESYLPRKIDWVMYNNHQLNKKEQKIYKEKQWGLLKNDFKNLSKNNIIAFDFSRDEGGLCSIKLGKKLKEIFK